MSREEGRPTGKAGESGSESGASPDSLLSRRAAMWKVARKAVYVAPVVITQAPSKAFAAGSIPCYPLGSPCSLDSLPCCDPYVCLDEMGMAVMGMQVGTCQ